MAVDQRLAAFRRRVAHRIRHGLIERGDGGKWPLGECLLRHPRRKLHDLADRRYEGLAIGGVEGVEAYLIHAATLGGDHFKRKGITKLHRCKTQIGSTTTARGTAASKSFNFGKRECLSVG